MEENRKHIDELFSAELGSYTELPQPAVWASLEKKLDDHTKRRAPYRWLWYALLAILASMVLYYAYTTVSTIEERNNKAINNNSTVISKSQDDEETASLLPEGENAGTAQNAGGNNSLNVQASGEQGRADNATPGTYLETHTGKNNGAANTTAAHNTATATNATQHAKVAQNKANTVVTGKATPKGNVVANANLNATGTNVSKQNNQKAVTANAAGKINNISANGSLPANTKSVLTVGPDTIKNTTQHKTAKPVLASSGSRRKAVNTPVAQKDNGSVPQDDEEASANNDGPVTKHDNKINSASSGNAANNIAAKHKATTTQHRPAPANPAIARKNNLNANAGNLANASAKKGRRNTGNYAAKSNKKNAANNATVTTALTPASGTNAKTFVSKPKLSKASRAGNNLKMPVAQPNNDNDITTTAPANTTKGKSLPTTFQTEKEWQSVVNPDKDRNDNGIDLNAFFNKTNNVSGGESSENTTTDNASGGGSNTEGSRKGKYVFDAGFKLGYEIGSGSYNANKFVAAPYLQYNITNGISVVMQPTIKYATLNKTDLGYSKPYYRLGNSTMDSNHSLVVPLPVDTSTPVTITRRYSYSQTHDSIVVSRAISNKNYIEFELPVMLQYKVFKSIGIYLGVAMNYSKLVQIEETQKEYNGIVRRDSLKFPSTLITSPRPAVPTAESRFTYDYEPYSNYKAGNAPNATSNPLRFSYTLGFNCYVTPRFFFDVMYTQMLSKPNYIPDTRLQEIYKQGYLRLSIGYRFTR